MTEQTGASNPAAKGGPVRARVSIGWLLVALVAVALIPNLVMTGILLERNNRAQQEVLTTLAEATAASIGETIDRELAGMTTTLRILATSRFLRLGDLPEFYARSNVALADTDSYLILVDENLRQMMNTRVPFGTELGPVGDPEPIQRALDRRETVVSNAFVGNVAERWVFNVAMPWTTAGEGRALILTRDAERLSSVIAGQNLRGGWNASVVDGNGIVIASTYLASDVGKPFFLWPTGHPAEAGSRVSAMFEGENFETISVNSSLSGWRIVVWAPQRTVSAPLTRTLQTFALGGALLVILGVTAAWALGRQVTSPVRKLAADARRLGAGEPVEERPFRIVEIATVSAALADAARDRQEAESEIRFLMREIAHRSKNQLTVVSSIAKQTARHAPDFASFQDAFQKRVQGLARSTDLLIAGGVAGVELRELIDAQLEPFRPGDLSRLSLNGPRCKLSNQAAQTIGLAVHELATNASKYGAFSTNTGRLAVDWAFDGDNLTIDWRETVPNLRLRPESRGFGTEVIERMLGGTLDAEIHRELRPEGLHCRFQMPLDKLRPDVQREAGHLEAS